jgi:hypothetical protein
MLCEVWFRGGIHNANIVDSKVGRKDFGTRFCYDEKHFIRIVLVLSTKARLGHQQQ